MGRFSDRVEAKEESVHQTGGVPFRLPGRAERSGGIGVPVDSQEEEAVYSGADRSREDDGDSVPCGKGGWRRTGESDLLSDSQDDHKDSGGKGFPYVKGAGTGLQGYYSDCKREDLLL